MATYVIYKDGVEENRILADEAFCREHYSSDGYSYELEPEENQPYTELQLLAQQVTDLELVILGGENNG